MSHRFWSTREVALLCRWVAAGIRPPVIAGRLGRTAASIRNQTRKLRRLGRLPPAGPRRMSPETAHRHARVAELARAGVARADIARITRYSVPHVGRLLTLARRVDPEIPTLKQHRAAERGRQIRRLRGLGLDTVTIAKRAGCSVRTVTNHLRPRQPGPSPPPPLP